MKNKRTPVTTKEILKYIRLRIGRLKEGINKDLKESGKESQGIRRAELDKLLCIIINDEIRKEINKMERHNYTRGKKR